MKVKKATKKTSPKNGNGKKIIAKSGNGKKVIAKNGNGKKASKESGFSGIKKQYLKSKDLCSVTFRLPKEAVPDAQEIMIVGDFNNWHLSETPMTKLKNGDFKVTLKLPRGKEYKFRYFIDSNRWENDWYADAYIANTFGTEDSLVKI